MVAGLPEAMTVSQPPRPSTVASNAATDSNHGDEPDKDSESDSARDITLEETVRILGDYVMLSRASVKPNLAATLPSPHQPLNRRRNFREVKFRWGNRWAASIIGSGAPIG